MSGKELLIPYDSVVYRVARQIRDLPHAAAPVFGLFIGLYCFDVCWRLFILGNLNASSPIMEPLAKVLQINANALSNILFAFIFVLCWWYPFILQCTRPLRTGAWMGITQDRLHLPINCIFSAKFRRHRDWSDIAYVTAGRSNDLLISFKSGGKAKLSLKNIPEDQRELIVLTFDTKCDGKRKDGSLDELLTQWHDKRLAMGESSATQIWEDEYNRRFRPTSFVPLDPGTRLRDDSVTVVKLLAFGGFSAVYLAQRNNGEMVVLKESVVQNASPAVQEKARELFQREAALLMKLNDPHIVRVLDHFRSNAREYLMLEYVRGENLRQVLRQWGSCEEPTALAWAHQIATILQTLHKNDPPIVHRDLTPDNLMLRDDEIVLIDFGAANECLGAATGTLIGKQSYIAPEQFRGKASPSSDLYSLGCTLAFLMTGADPEPLRQSVIPASEKISAGLSSLIASLTEQDASRRIKTAEELVRTLEALDAQHQSHEVEECAAST